MTVCVNVCVQMSVCSINDRCVTGIHLWVVVAFQKGAEILMETICLRSHACTHRCTHLGALLWRKEKIQLRLCERERVGAGTRECHPVCFLGPPLDFAVFNMFTYSARRQVRITNAANQKLVGSLCTPPILNMSLQKHLKTHTEHMLL